MLGDLSWKASTLRIVKGSRPLMHEVDTRLLSPAKNRTDEGKLTVQSNRSRT